MIKVFWDRMLAKAPGKPAAGKVEVVFSIRLKGRPLHVAVAGSFNRWSCFSHFLSPSPSGAWETTLRLAPGAYRYRFLVDNVKWILDPRADAVTNEFGGADSILIVRSPESVTSAPECAPLQVEQYV